MAQSNEFSLGMFSDVEDDSDTESETESQDEEQQVPVGPARWDQIFAPNLLPFQKPPETIRSELGLDPTSSPLSILRKLITDEMISEVCHQTNLYAQEIKRSKPTAMPRWKPVTEEEFWIFLALNLAMGICHKPTIHDYWTTNRILSSPFFPSQMSRNRFEDILRALHLHENASVPAGCTNRFIKLGSFMTSFVANCRSSVNPGEFLCLVESLMAYKGRLSFRQYNPQKRNRFGIKYFLLVDRETNVLLEMLPYQGQATDIPQTNVKELGFGGAAVMKMLQAYLNKSHKIVIDNYFNSPTLARNLLKEKTYVLGTAQKRRKQMPLMMPAKMKKGDVQTYSDGSILVERWMDRREVVMLNTFRSHSMQQSNSTNPFNARSKPASVLLYNKTMGAVDEMDKMIKYYANMRKTYKWYKKVFFYLVDAAVYNAFRLSCGIKQRSPAYKEFILALIEEITKPNPYVRSGQGRPHGTENVTGQSIQSSSLHLPRRMLTKSGNTGRGNCKNCKGPDGNGPRVTTQFKCTKCNIWLCIEIDKQCFEEYHLKQVRGSSAVPAPVQLGPRIMPVPVPRVRATNVIFDSFSTCSSNASTFVPARASTPTRLPSSFEDSEDDENGLNFIPSSSFEF